MANPKSAYSVSTKKEKSDTHIIVVWVDNEAGVLARVVGLFSGRGYNIESLAVAEVDAKRNISRITIVTTGTPQVIDQIKNNPDSRRLIVSAWNVGEIENMALPPCHAFFQFYVANGKLSCQLYQRSADIFLGVPFNIASYALLTMMIAQVCNLEVGEFVHTLGDAHLYSNHLEQAELQLSRETKTLPKMKINPEIKNIFEFTIDDFELLNYDPHPHIKGIVAV